MSESEMSVIRYAAMIALADANIARRVGEMMNLSDAEINNLQYKLYMEICQ